MAAALNWSLRIELGLGWQTMVDELMMNPMSPQRAAILAVLQQASEPMRVAEIAAATGMKAANVAQMLLRMRTDGQAQYVFRGSVACWQVVPPKT